MPKRCAVPNCNSNRRGEKSKRSVFRVPKDITLLKKWEEAIPGVIKLERSHIVCDKHFQAKDISREWIKCDSNGQIIAQVPYKYPKLNKAAVPSQFCDTSTYGKENSDPSHEYIKYTPNDLIPTNENGGYPSRNSPKVVSIEPVSLMKPSMQMGTLVDTSCVNLLAVNDAPSLSLTDASNCDKVVSIDPVSLMKPSMQMMGTLVDTCVASLAVNDAPSLSLTDASNCDPLVSSDLLADQKPFKVLSSIVISKRVPEESESTCAELSMIVPDSWSVAELRLESGQRILFSYAITKLENGMNCPVTQKCVTLDVDRTLNYYVYGRHVNHQEMKLDRILNKKEMLPDILIKFKEMDICSGLGDVSIHLVPADGAYQDYIQKWRSKDCFLVSKTKRCNCCVKCRKYILQRTARLRTRPTMNRIRDVSNPIDQCKLSAMRIRNRCERRQKLRAQERVKHLMTCIKEQGAQIERMQNSTLDAKCAELNVPASQKLALKEIIATASKKYARKK